jgi:hypothetical protein
LGDAGLIISEQERVFGLQADGDPVDHVVSAESVADGNAKALSLFAEGDADYVTDDAPSILGQPARSFEQFATEYAAAFS